PPGGRRHDHPRPARTRQPSPAGERPRLQDGVQRMQEQAARRGSMVNQRPEEEQMSRRMRKTGLIGLAGVAAAAATGAAIGLGGEAAGTGCGSGPAVATALVTRATLTQTQQVSGTLDYGSPVTVDASGGGVITWLPTAGAVIRRGQPV